MEYKVLQPNLGLRNHADKLQDILNNEAISGWKLHTMNTTPYGQVMLVFERDKHR